MTPQKRLTFSAVIPCHNAGAQLATTIDSLLAQTVPFDEIVVVDDGSTDNSTEVANAYGARVRLVTQPHKGAAVARHTGVMVSRFDVVVFCDAGDKSLPTRLALFVEAFEKAPDAVAATAETSAPFDDGEGPKQIAPLRFNQDFSIITEPYDYYIASCVPLALAMNIAIKKVIAVESVKISPFYRAANDFSLQARTSKAGIFVHINYCTVTYAPTPKGITAKFGINKQKSYALVAAIELLNGLTSERSKSLFADRIRHEWIGSTKQMLRLGELRAASKIIRSCFSCLSIADIIKSVWWDHINRKNYNTSNSS